MSRSSALILLGVLVLIAPFSGVPSSWLSVVLPLLGLLVAGIGLAIRSERVRQEEAASAPAPAAPDNDGPSVIA